jgi:hypothetical protein
MAQLHFLEPHEAWVRLRASPFWSTVQPGELQLRYGESSREAAWDRLQRDGFVPFDDEDRRALNQTLREAEELWRRRFGRPLPATTIALGKWPSKYDWGYPYTVGDMIAVPSGMTRRFPAITLLHETLHLWQRRDSTRFARAYWTEWGFEFVPRPLAVPASVRAGWVSNPDGWDNHRWIWTDPASGRPWCLVCVLDPAHGTPTARAVAVDRARHALDPRQGLLEEADLARAFGDLGQLYHPHEILAKHLERWLTGRGGEVPAVWRGVLFRV